MGENTHNSVALDVGIGTTKKKSPIGRVYQETTKDPLSHPSGLNRASIGQMQNFRQAKTAVEKTWPSAKLTKSAFNNMKEGTLGDEKAATGKGIGSALKSGIGALGSAISSPLGNAVMDMTASLIPDSGKNTNFQAQQQIGNALMSVNPMIGGIYKAASIVGELTGTNVSQMTKDQAKAAGINNATRFANNFASYLPGVGILGSIAKAEKSHVIDSMASAYGGTVGDINTAGTMSGQNYLFGRGKASNFIYDMNEKNRIMTDINTTNTLRKSSDYGIDLAQQNLNRYAGTNYMNMRMGKHGMKFATLDEIRVMLANRKQVKEVEKFANGGTLNGENLIPSGMLHARLNHIHESDPELAANLTKKGIPVVAITENGDYEQIAEIENSELILTQALTKKLEELRKDGSDEAMIEAGKLLVDEILFNVQDNVGIVNE